MLETTGLDDQDHLAVIGALSRAMSTKMPGFQLRTSVKPGWLENAHTQGVSTPNEELDYLPLDGDDHTNTSGGVEDYEAQMVALPQRPFRGERLVLQCVFIAVGGAASDGLFRLIITPAMYIGAVQIGATQGQMPASAFGPGAFGVRLSMPAAGQGTRVYMPFRFAGLNPNERIIVAGGLFGRAVR